MRKDEYGFDSQKLIYHPERVAQWLKDPFSVYPIYVEIAPTNNCNHRCTFCGCDFLDYQKIFLHTPILLERLTEMAKLGIKSIMYAGEGEPLLHKDIAEIILHTKEAGIDVAITTNGVALTRKLAENILGSLSWIKVSIDAGTKKTYSQIHGCPENHFEMVLKNLEAAVKIKEKNKYSCTIGTQMILLPENRGEASILARKVKSIGVDYLVIKPHSQYPLSITKKYKDLIYFSDDLENLEKQMEGISDHKFQAVVRRHTMEKLGSKGRGYDKCLAVPFFWTYLDSGGNVWSCSVYLTNPRFLCGNIYENSFEEIWQGESRRKNMELLKELDVSRCRKNCRMDESNRYLWLLKNPPKHVNFP